METKNMRNSLADALLARPQKELAAMGKSLRAFHEDDRGDNENLGRMLVLALILVPIVIVLTVFGNEIVKQAKEIWTKVIGGKVTT
jgi:hypothetical protein